MEKRRVIRLTASAGAGKTYALALRYLKLLLAEEGADSLPRILAITFTNKAAGEMRERIIGWLKGLCLGEDLPKVRQELREELGADDETLRRRSLSALGAIFRSPKDFQVRTIDSFLTSMAHSAAWEMGISPGAQVEVRPDKLLSEAVSRLMELVESDADVAREMTGFVMGQAAVRQDMEWSIKELITKKARRLRALETMRGEAFPASGPTGENYAVLLEGLADVAGEILAMCEGGKVECRGNWPEKLKQFVATKDIKPLVSSVHFTRDDPASALPKSYLPPAEFLDAWRRFRKTYSAICIHRAVASAAPYVSVVARLERIMKEMALRDGSIILDRLPFDFACAFREEESLLTTFFYWGERLEHLLIDEFQDTSLVQWRAFGPLGENALSQGGTLFFVGDRKQSIYGFRGGNPELFDTVVGELERFGVLSEPLGTNWRSGRELVDFVGEAFSKEKLEEWVEGFGKCDPLTFKGIVKDNIGALSAEFDNVRQEADRAGGLVIAESLSLPAEVQGREEMIAFIARKACDEIVGGALARGYRQSDVAFLVRDNFEASLVSRTLLENGLRVASKATLSLDSNPTTLELKAFLKFLDSPIDDLAFSTFFLGRVFSGAAGAPPREQMLEFLTASSDRRWRPLYPLFRERFPDAWKGLIEPSFNSVGYQPPYDLLQSALERFDVRERFPGVEAFTYKFLDLMRVLETGGSNSIRAFLDAWDAPGGEEDLQVPLPDGADAVKVMTIHKSKGLGLPVVIIPIPYLNGKRESMLAVEAGEWATPAILNQDVAVVSPILMKAYIEEAMRVALSEMNALYVASTRAERELYIYIPSPLGRGQKVETPFWETRRGSAASQVGKEADPIDCPRPLPRAGSWEDKLLISHREALGALTEDALRAKRRGTLVHLALQRGAASEVEVEAALGPESPSTQEMAEVWSALQKLGESPKISQLWRPPAAVELHDEVSIIDGDGELKRIDRLLISGGDVTVVDWKTGVPDEEKHFKQVSNYCRLVDQLYPDKTVRGVLVYVDELECREVQWQS